VCGPRTGRRARGGLGAGGGGVRVDPVARKGMTGGSPAVSDSERGGGLLANTGRTGRVRRMRAGGDDGQKAEPGCRRAHASGLAR
jgi:hypothetical protein